MRALLLALLLAPALVAGRPMTFAWENANGWPDGTTLTLEANGVTASGITGTSHTLDVPVNDGTINSRVRAIPPEGMNIGASSWATYSTRIAGTSPLPQSNPSRAALIYGDFTMPVPSPWVNTDIGATGAPGSADYTSGTGTFTVQGAGEDIWGASDTFHYVYQTLTGDGSITARVVALDATHAQAKAGVMIRDTLNANARYGMTAVAPNANTVNYQRRFTTGAGTIGLGSATQTVPVWVRVTRSGTSLAGFYSSDGVAWNSLGNITITLPNTVYVGLIVFSHISGTLATATIDNVTITTPGGPVSLSGVTSSVASVAGNLSVSGGGTAVSLSSAAVAVPSASGTLSTQIPMSAAAASVVSSNGQLGLSVTLAGSALTNVLASGELFEAGSASLAGAASVVAGATGNLGLSLLISGSALVDALAQGNLLSTIGLSADAAGRVSATGDLAALGAGALGGSAGVVVGSTGNLGMAIPIQGNAVGRVTAGGELTNLAPISGSATVTTVGGGLLQVMINAPLSADAQAVVAAGGSLSMTIPLSGNAVAVALASGTLSGGAVAWMPSPTRTWTPGYVPRVWHPPAPQRTWRVS